MNQNKNYIFVPKKLACQYTEICRKKLFCINDDEAEKILSDTEQGKILYSERLDNKKIVSVILWASKSNSINIHSRIIQFWKQRRSIESLKAIYREWQNNYDSESFTNLCGQLLEYEDCEINWISQWKRWITARNVPMIAAGTAAAFCHYYNQKYKDWLKLYKIEKDSRLGKKINELFLCYCSAKEFICTDEELLIYISHMNNFQRERLLRNIMRRFFITDDNDEDTENSGYIDKYRKSIEYLCSEMPDNEISQYIMQTISTENTECCI